MAYTLISRPESLPILLIQNEKQDFLAILCFMQYWERLREVKPQKYFNREKVLNDFCCCVVWLISTG